MAQENSSSSPSTPCKKESSEENVFQLVKKQVHWLLHGDASSPVVQIGGTLEKVSGVSRDYIFYGLVTLFVGYLVFGDLAELVCNTVGFAYPAYASYQAIESASTVDDTQWLTYWTVFASLSLVDFANRVLHSIPLYWVIKCTFLLWLYLPAYKGADKLYKCAVVPFMKHYGPAIKKIIDEAKNRTKTESEQQKEVPEEQKTNPDGIVKTTDRRPEQESPKDQTKQEVVEKVADNLINLASANINPEEKKPNEAPKEEQEGYLSQGIDMIQDAMGFN